MSYRDDHEALRSYHDTLARELTRLEARTAELTTVEADRARVARELARVRADLDQQRARRSPIRLDNLRVASPCKESWDRMTGDDRVRDCARCDKQVFNLSAMTAADAEELLASRGVTACVRFYRRPDGTVMTSDCPEGVKRQRRVMAVAAGALASAAGIAGVMTMGDAAPSQGIVGIRPDVVDEPIMGKMAFDPPPPPPTPVDVPPLEMIQGGASAPPTFHDPIPLQPQGHASRHKHKTR